MVRVGWLIFLVVLMDSCAQMRTPEGGPVDTEPPVPVEFYPEEFTLHFSAKEFSITFDEYVQLKNLQSQLLISPPLKKNPQAVLKGKTLTISWEDTLQENTTYLFNFGNAVVDYTEGNSAQNLIYVFSTGDFIDSLQFSGMALEAFTNKPAAGMTMLLYSGTADSLPRTTRPNYVAITDSSGHFTFNYMREGSYKIFGVQDQNGNFLFDQPTEAIAFDTVRINPSPADTLPDKPAYASFINADTAQFIRGFSNTDYGRITISFNQPVVQPRVEVLVTNGSKEGKKLPYKLYLNERKDSLVAWVSGLSDAEALNIIAADSGLAADTSYWYRELNPKYSKKPQLGLTNSLKKGKLDIKQVPRFAVENPLDSIDVSAINLLEDSVPVDFELNYTDSLSRNFEVTYDYAEGKKYILTFPDSTIWDMYGATNDSVVLNFQLQDRIYYGRFKLNVELDSLSLPQVLIQLWQGKELIKQTTLQKSAPVVYNFLAPGTFQIKAVFDRDMDGQWTTGFYENKRQPEAVDWLPQEITIRSNWDLEQDWRPTPPTDQ